MARGTSLELRCGDCHSTPIFPASERARQPVLGELYVSPRGTWMAWSGPYRGSFDQERNWLPGPRQDRGSGPGTTWRPVPTRGITHECRRGHHRMALSEAELWALVRALPTESDTLYLPSEPVRTEFAATPDPSVSPTHRDLQVGHRQIRSRTG